MWRGDQARVVARRPPLSRPMSSRVPFLLVFFGVLGGLAAFGSLGLFVGPVVISLFLVIWREWTEVEP